jgi:hypothetical protein
MVILNNCETILVRDLITVYKDSEDKLVLEWRSSDLANIIGDCLGYMFYNITDFGGD